MKRPKAFLKTVTALLFLCLTVSAYGQSICDSLPEYRRFDFWLGEWDVYMQDNKIGESSITSTNGNCGILEDYRPLHRSGGNSISYYDASSGKWHQDWVSNGRVSHYAEPDEYEEGEMQLIATHEGENGNNVYLKMIYHAIDSSGDVRQEMYLSKDEMETWNNIFNGLYKRKQE